MTNLPVPHEQPLITYSNPEELAAASHAMTLLARIVSQHRKGYEDAPEEETIEHPDAYTGFRYGQNWDIEPEVWDLWDENPDLWEL